MKESFSWFNLRIIFWNLILEGLLYIELLKLIFAFEHGNYGLNKSITNLENSVELITNSFQ